MINVCFNRWYGLVLPLLLVSLVGCANEGALQRLPAPPKVTQVKLAMASTTDLPDFARQAEPRVRDAYRFVVANPEVMTKIPCYCGCGSMGHQHARQCFIKNVAPSGQIEFDNHAAGCGICVDITQDVMKMTRASQDLKTIRAFVDAEYSQFAAPTNTPLIE